MDLTNVHLSNENGFIELESDDLTLKLKPKSLRFETFNIPSWNYFLLELETLNDIVVSNNNIIPNEDLNYIEVIETVPGKYIDSWCRHYDRDMTSKNKPLIPKSARRI